MAKRYGYKDFTATANGKEYTFECYTTDTRNGFCHHAIVDGVESRVSWCNRTWESFQYESVLRKAVEKFPKKIREELNDTLLEKTKKEVHERVEREVKAFENAYNALKPETKEQLAKSNIMLESEEQVNIATKIMQIGALMGA